MERQLERRSEAQVMTLIVLAAGIVAVLLVVLMYIAVHNFRPTVSCNELLADTVDGELGKSPPKTDAWDDWELLCGYYDR